MYRKLYIQHHSMTIKYDTVVAMPRYRSRCLDQGRKYDSPLSSSLAHRAQSETKRLGRLAGADWIVLYLNPM